MTATKTKTIESSDAVPTLNTSVMHVCAWVAWCGVARRSAHAMRAEGWFPHHDDGRLVELVRDSLVGDLCTRQSREGHEHGHHKRHHSRRMLRVPIEHGQVVQQEVSSVCVCAVVPVRRASCMYAPAWNRLCCCRWPQEGACSKWLHVHVVATRVPRCHCTVRCMCGHVSKSHSMHMVKRLDVACPTHDHPSRASRFQNSILIPTPPPRERHGHS